MSSMYERWMALLSKRLENDSARAAKSVRKEVEEAVEDLKLGKQAGKEGAKTSRKAAVLGGLGAKGKNAFRAAEGKVDDILAIFDSDVEKCLVEKGRKKALGEEMTKRERSVASFKRTAADSGKDINKVLQFGLKPHQANTLEQLLGQLFGQAIEMGGSPETRKAQEAANKLIAAMKKHWDAAMPKGSSRADLLNGAFAKMKAFKQANPTLSASKTVRTALFDPWRKRFMKSLAADEALVRELREAAGIQILTDGDTPRFFIELKVGAKKVQIGFDVDHAETRLSEAVRDAKAARDLGSVIDSEGMQLLTPRENQREIEALRKASREYDAAADAAASTQPRKGASQADLDRYLDRALDALDRPGDML